MLRFVPRCLFFIGVACFCFIVLIQNERLDLEVKTSDFFCDRNSMCIYCCFVFCIVSALNAEHMLERCGTHVVTSQKRPDPLSSFACVVILLSHLQHDIIVLAFYVQNFS